MHILIVDDENISLLMLRAALQVAESGSQFDPDVVDAFQRTEEHVVAVRDRCVETLPLAA